MDGDDAEHGSQATTNPADDLPAIAVATELLNRTNALLTELEAFSTLVEAHRRPPILGHRAFIQDINAEKRFVERLLQKALAETTTTGQQGSEENGEAGEEKDPLDALAADRKIKHQLSSTNITSYEAQWAAVKTCRGLVALRQTFSRRPPARRPRKGDTRALSPSSKIKAHVKKTQDGVLVDAVVDDGRAWLKVSAVSERQLLFQMARQGWRNDSDSDADSDAEELGKKSIGGVDGGARNDDGDDDNDESDDEDEIAIVRLAKHLTQAARANRHAYRHPRVRLVLPKLEEGRVKEIDAVLARIRATSTPAAPLVLETGPASIQPPSSSSTTTTITSPSPSDNNDAPRCSSTSSPPDLRPLLTNPFAAFTPTLNIDCTLLVALASDISHARCVAQPWHPGSVQGQIRDEAREALLPHTLYPALLAGGAQRRLVCTVEAARRMREIVATIGTESEVARAELLLSSYPDEDGEDGEREGEGEGEGRKQQKTERSREEIVAAFQALSVHPVPADLQLPIVVVPSSNPTATSTTTNNSNTQDPPSRKLPPLATAVADQLTDINRSIFLHGWAQGITTLSSNGTVVKQIETAVERHRERDEDVGPDVWVCPVARSLVAKEGRRQG